MDRIVMTSREESVLDLRARDPASQDNQEEEEGEEEADFVRRQRGKKLRVATWSQGTRVVVGQGSLLKVFERSHGQPRTMVELLVDEDLSQRGGGGGIDFDDAKAFFVVDDEAQEEEERSGRGGRHPQTWIVAVTKRLVDRLQRLQLGRVGVRRTLTADRSGIASRTPLALSSLVVTDDRLGLDRPSFVSAVVVVG